MVELEQPLADLLAREVPLTPDIDPLQVLATDADVAPKSWAGGLPKLELPISVRVDAFDLRDLRVGPAAAASDSSEATDAPAARVDRIAGTLSLSRGRLSVASLVVDRKSVV